MTQKYFQEECSVSYLVGIHDDRRSLSLAAQLLHKTETNQLHSQNSVKTHEDAQKLRINRI
jgi:hypothetical protein